MYLIDKFTIVWDGELGKAHGHLQSRQVWTKMNPFGLLGRQASSGIDEMMQAALISIRWSLNGMDFLHAQKQRIWVK